MKVVKFCIFFLAIDLSSSSHQSATLLKEDGKNFVILPSEVLHPITQVYKNKRESLKETLNIQRLLTNGSEENPTDAQKNNSDQGGDSSVLGDGVDPSLDGSGPGGKKNELDKLELSQDEQDDNLDIKKEENMTGDQNSFDFLSRILNQSKVVNLLENRLARKTRLEIFNQEGHRQLRSILAMLEKINSQWADRSQLLLEKMKANENRMTKI